MKPILTTVALAILIGNTSLAIAEPYIQPYKPSVRQIIVKQATVYATPAQELIQTMQCESGLRNDGVYGDQGRAYGIAQYHRPTFERYAKLMGEKLDYYSRDDQIKLMAWQFKNIPSSKKEWTCWTKFYGVK